MTDLSIGAVRDYVLLFLLPVWIAVGLLDWWCHRRAGIERYGIYEPLLHIFQIGSAGLPILLGLFLEITPPVLLLMLGCFVLHEIVGYLDVRWANSIRGISPVEQRLHDYLVALPVAALSLVLITNWTDFLSLFQAPVAALQSGLYWRDDSLGTPTVAVILLAVLLFNLLPFAEELLRALRSRASHPEARKS